MANPTPIERIEALARELLEEADALRYLADHNTETGEVQAAAQDRAAYEEARVAAITLKLAVYRLQKPTDREIDAECDICELFGDPSRPAVAATMYQGKLLLACERHNKTAQ